MSASSVDQDNRGNRFSESCGKGSVFVGSLFAPRHVVRIGSASGEVDALVLAKQDHAQAIVRQGQYGAGGGPLTPQVPLSTGDIPSGGGQSHEMLCL